MSVTVKVQFVLETLKISTVRELSSVPTISGRFVNIVNYVEDRRT